MRRDFLRSAFALAALGLLPLLASAAGDAGTPMLLPPMLVQDHRNGPVWRYAAVGGLEVLSRCDDSTTTAFITSYLRRRLELEQLLPPDLQLRQAVPLAIILITPAVEKTMNEELVRTMNATQKTETSGYITPEASAWQVYRLVRTLPQLTLSDDESTSMVCTLDPSQRGPVAVSGEASGFFKGLADDGTYRDMNFTAGRIGALLAGRAPPLPSWFKSGFLSLYHEIAWSAHSDTVVASPVFWISNALTKQVRRMPDVADFMNGSMAGDGNQTKASAPAGPDSYQVSGDTRHPAGTPLGLLPMRKFFAGPLGGAAPLTPDESLLWGAQASLFFHWAYADPARRAALWRFVDRSSREAVTEDLIRECFGLSSHRLEEALLAYLPKAAKSPLTLVDATTIRIPEFRLTNATHVDAARIKGDMGRKEITYVKDLDPLSVVKYVDEVGAVLKSPVEDNERDPAQLAVLGLYDCDLGNNDEARPLLEEAAAARVARPAVYLQLAKIRYGQEVARAAAADGKLGPEQVAALLGLLREGRRYLPAQVGTYLLAADIWNQAAVPPSHENLALLAEGVALFPDNADLVTAAAALYVQNGLGQEAIALVDRALSCAEPDSLARVRLLQYRGQLTVP